MESTENIDFYNYWCIFKRRWLPAVTVFGSLVVLTFMYTASKAPIYKAQGQLLFKEDATTSLIGLNSQEQGNSQSQANSQSGISTEARLIRSNPILQKALVLINQENSIRKHLTLDDLEQGLDIKIIEGTDILQVGYKSKNPAVAALVVNKLMKAYVDNNLLANRAAAISAGSFITGQLPLVKANVDRTDVAIRSFKEKYKITDLAQTQASVAANLERIGAQIDSVQAQLADLNSRSTTLRNKLGMSSEQAISMSLISQSPAVQGVVANLQELQRKLADLRSRYQESHPIITDLKDKEAQLTILLKEQIAQVLQSQKTVLGKLQFGSIQQELLADLIKSEVSRIGLVTQLATLSNQQAFYRRQADILPKLEQQQREQMRDLSAAQSTYETLLKNLQEIRVIENRTVGNVRIVEAGQIPGSPISPNRTSAMAAGTLAGILIATAVVYLLEVRDKKIKTVKEARELFEYTVLGTIPVFGKKSRVKSVGERNSALPVIESPRSSISERYRMLQANLRFLNSDKASKVIVVTSSVPKEGKSTTSANLAAVIAQLGYRVLIIDADMRRPSQHHIWQISNEVGLMNIIVGQSNLDENVIQRVLQNLYVLTAGVSTSNSPVLLDSRSMYTLIEQYQNHYEYVIIDTPPLAISADAPILGKIADGVILVTRPGLADSINAKLTKEYLDQSGQNIMGIVVNGVLRENEPHSYYYHEKK